MASTTYTRRDHIIRILPADSFAHILVTPPGGSTGRTPVDRTIVDRAALGDHAELREILEPTLSAAAARIERPSTIERVLIEVGDRRWAAIAFESWLPAGGWLVRTSPVYPRVLRYPLRFPVRVLEIGGPPTVAAAIDQTFHESYREDAFVDANTSLEEAETFVVSRRWKTVDVLHVHALTTGPALLSTARAEEPGTVGWLMRFAERFQTRLILVEGEEEQRAQLRIAAQMNVDRGGPAVWLFERPGNYAALYGDIAHDRPLDWIRGSGAGGELFTGSGAEEALRYSTIGEVLAQPQTVQEVVRSVRARISAWRNLQALAAVRPKWWISPTLDPEVIATTIVQTAEMMRIPVIRTTIPYRYLWGTRAERLGDAISTRLAQQGFVVSGLDTHLRDYNMRGGDIAIGLLTDHVRTNARPLARMTRKAAADAIVATLVRVGQEMPGYTFEDHESEGMLPLASKVAYARTLAESLGRATRVAEAAAQAYESVVFTPREVNISFVTTTSRGRIERLAQATTRLVVMETVNLGVRIAPKEAGIKTLGSMAFLEEAIEWSEDGAWIEIGVTGIDFTVLGDPVQQVWLPRDAPMEYVLFAVQPYIGTVPGVARLRLAIYHRNNVIQSFLVAALLTTAGEDPAPAIAQALNATVDDVRSLGEVGYLARLEYATASIAAADSASPRGLTIIANDSAGDKVVTLKGNDLFTVIADRNLPGKVDKAREALDRASTHGGEYPYNFEEHINVGDPDRLLETLWDLAVAGFGIFNLLVIDPDEQKSVRATVASDGGIHAAHIDAASVIPWSLVYDRLVFPTKTFSETDSDSKIHLYNVARGLCRVSMPDAENPVRDVNCGGPGCLLNAAANEQRKRAGDDIYLEETVICPRRFWGFMVPIEVPAQQVKGVKGKATTPLVKFIRARQPPTVAGAFNPNLEFAASHADDLEKHVFTVKQHQKESVRASLVKPDRSGRDAVRQLLQQADPEIVYLFCHALAPLKTADRTYGPALDFGKGYDGVVEDRMDETAFAVKAGEGWTRAPLVFINGCSTVGFSPYAPSEFIKQFVVGRHASAVIGTEVTVWEALATEMAKRFLMDFLDGKTSAGEALLHARRALLAMNNPLGLAYTLYGSASLTLGKSGD